MDTHAQKAFDALTALGVPLRIDPDEGGYFVIMAELFTDDGELFADYYQEELREHESDGRIQNMFGIRTDVNDILAENGMYCEWINPAMLGTYNG